MTGYSGFVCGECKQPVDFALEGDHLPGCPHAAEPAVEVEADPDSWDSWFRSLPAEPEGDAES
jgi:hypothetical protein